MALRFDEANAQKAGYNTHYSGDYLELLFQTWYRNAKPGLNQLLDIVPLDENGRKPNEQYIYKIKMKERWEERAKEYDKSVQDRLKQTAVDARVLMLEEHAKLASELIESSMEYIRQNGFDSSSAAIRAFVEGVKLERESRVPSEVLSKIATLPTPKLQERIMKLLERVDQGQDMSAEEFYGEEEETEDNSDSEGEEYE